MTTEPVSETTAVEQDKPTEPRWTMVLQVGPVDGDFETAKIVDLTPASVSVEDVTAAVAAAGLTPADLRSRVLFAASADSAYRAAALAVYAAVCGFAGRRLDAWVSGTVLELGEFDRVLRAAEDSGRPAEAPEQVQVGGPVRADMVHVDLTTGFTPDALSFIRFARRLRFAPADDTAVALSQLVAIAAVRSRAGMDRFPLLVEGDEPADLGTGAEGAPVLPGTDLHAVRRHAEELRRSLRGDTRDAVADFVEPSPRSKRLVEASTKDLAETLARLGSRSTVINVPERDAEGNLTGGEEPVQAWHCLKPEAHTNGDATPSARILPTHDDQFGFRCFRCLPEKVDALRLVMWAKNCSVDEAADWLLS